jgi:hypothetical protein
MMFGESGAIRNQLRSAHTPLQSSLWGALALLLALAGCGGSSDSGNGDMPPPSAEQVKACSTAFQETVGGRSMTAAGSPDEPKLLSACLLEAKDPNRNVTIGAGGCGPDVIIDKSFKDAEALGQITIKADGKLVLPRHFDQIELHTKGISVAGLLSLGTAACPVGVENPESQIKVKFTGKRAQADDSAGGADKGIAVLPGGILRMYGIKGVTPVAGRKAPEAAGVSWTHLAQPAGPGKYRDLKGIATPVTAADNVIMLARNVTEGAGAWRPNDWIVIATSSFSPFESEFVQIKKLTFKKDAGVTEVELTKALRHYHFGGADPGVPSATNYGAGKEINFGVDERSEVGLISRNVVLTAQTPTPGPTAAEADLHWGGEIRIHKNYKEVSIEGVELEKFGKERLGSYPIHFHQAGTPTGSHLINSNSIHHSYNKCVAIHSTSDISINNNVCARAIGHLFYQEIGDEKGISFRNNLGLGAMSHYFDVDPAPQYKNESGDGFKNYWEGDNLARNNQYDGFKIQNMDSHLNPTSGGCYVGIAAGPDKGLLLAGRSLDPKKVDDRCDIAKGEYYVEQATGFWIVNPSTELIGNSVGGCQGMGKGYWYVTPPKDPLLMFNPVGTFRNNRVHACFDGVFAETEMNTVTQQLFPRNEKKENLVTTFDGLTATRIRNRGIWVRPTWNAITNGRFATNRDSATLVSSGGADGNAPGVWALLKDSVFVGVSANNVDRWGPCPDDPSTQENKGCVDYNPQSHEINEKKYQTPFWNSAGYMVYDGPVRILRNHFVNFLKDPSALLTSADAALLKNFKDYPKKNTVYEGDAALGWFQSNQSAYPTATVTRELSFENVDLRHQIYTEHTDPAEFGDGDKNTALVDLDGSLTGYKVVGPDGKAAPGEYPISLNNLPFNYASNSVDECLATGAQDEMREGRASSLISPANMASLEFEALYPVKPFQHWQDMIFTKTNQDAGAFQSMRLQSRNGMGIWEPKVASGFGYVVESAETTKQLSPDVKAPNGMPNRVNVGLTDAVKPDMDKKPFYVRIGIRYVDSAGRKLSASDFKLERGFKTWAGGPVDLTARAEDWRRLFNKYDGNNAANGNAFCWNLDGQNAQNVGANGCPADGIMQLPLSGTCPAGSQPSGSFCVFKKKPLVAVAKLEDLTKPDGTTNPDGSTSSDQYFYDSDAGMLFFYVQQKYKNAHGTMPFGSCPGDKTVCPDENELDTYFPCPPQGCVVYSVNVDPQRYTPAPNVTPLSPAQVAKYEQAPPQNQNRLAFVNADGTIGDIVESEPKMSSKNFLHWPQKKGEFCSLRVPVKKPLKQASRAVSHLTVAARLDARTPWQRWFAAKPKEAREAPKLAMADVALPVCRAVE